MIIESKVCFEEASVQLEEGIDYSKCDLKVDKFTVVGRCLSSDQLTEIAKKNGFDKWSWVGNIYPDDAGQYPTRLAATFRKYH